MQQAVTAAAILITLMALPGAAQNVRTLPANSSSPPATLDAVAWMAGRWTGEAFGGQAEEVFSPPAGGAMVGHYRNWTGGKVNFYELETIVEEKGSLVYRLKHFNADLTGWEEKDRTVEFPLVAVEEDHIYFDGLTIERIGPDEMRHFLLLKGTDGKTREVELRYRRAD